MLGPKTTPLSIALLLIALVPFLPVCENGFIDFDDELHIVNNPHVTSGLSWSNFCWAWTTFHGNYWQPLSWLSLQVDAQLFSQDVGGRTLPLPAAIHVHSLLWHAASALLLFLLLRRATAAPWRSFLVAALFAVHPMRVESIAWADERKDVLSVFFGLVAVWAYVRYADQPGWPRYLVVVAAFLMSLCSKPMLMTLPCVLLLLDYWPLQRFALFPGSAAPESAPQKTSVRRLITEKLPLFLMVACIARVTWLARAEMAAGVPLSELSLRARLANIPFAYGQYLLSTFWPLNLAVFYPHPRNNWSAAGVGAGLAVLAAITILAIWQARRRPWLIVGWLWFVGTLTPVIGMAQGGEQAWADRFSYWPHIGLIIALVWEAAELVAWLRIPVFVYVSGAAGILGCLAVLTWIQTGYWHDSISLWQRDLDVTHCPHAHAQLGKHFLQRGRLDLARSHFAAAVAMFPDSADYHLYLGEALLGLGKNEEAAAQFRETLRRKHDYADAWYNAGFNELRRRKPEAALWCFQKVLELQPGSTDALAGTGAALLLKAQSRQAAEVLEKATRQDPADNQAWSSLGYARLALGQTQAAYKCFSEALRLNPQSAKAHSGLGTALGRLGKWDEAARSQGIARDLALHQEEKLEEMGGRLPPEELADVRCRLAFSLHQAGYTQLASTEYEAALQQDPGWPRRFTAQAWKLATDPDPERRDPHLASELASQVVQASNTPPASALDALAAAKAALTRSKTEKSGTEK